MTNEVPEYRAYCDICKGGSEWFVLSVESAKAWRDLHFDDQHSDNPMQKTNCRIQRRMIDVERVFDNQKTQAGMVAALNHE